jgi:hypothetical protein
MYANMILLYSMCALFDRITHTYIHLCNKSCVKSRKFVQCSVIWIVRLSKDITRTLEKYFGHLISLLEKYPIPKLSVLSVSVLVISVSVFGYRLFCPPLPLLCHHHLGQAANRW